MGVKEVSTWTISCDRCPRSEPIDHDPKKTDFDNGWAWWNRVGPQGAWGTEQRLLCPDCTKRLNLFFQGHKTPAGMQFNHEEAARVYNAHEAWMRGKGVDE